MRGRHLWAGPRHDDPRGREMISAGISYRKRSSSRTALTNHADFPIDLGKREPAGTCLRRLLAHARDGKDGLRSANGVDRFAQASLIDTDEHSHRLAVCRQDKVALGERGPHSPGPVSKFPHADKLHRPKCMASTPRCLALGDEAGRLESGIAHSAENLLDLSVGEVAVGSDDERDDVRGACQLL